MRGSNNQATVPSIEAVPVKFSSLNALAKSIRRVNDFAGSPFGFDNPPVQMITNWLGVPALANTLEDLAYGMPVTLGSGQTLKLRPQAQEAALAVLPSAKPVAVAAGRGARAAGKALAPVAADMMENALRSSGMVMDVVPGRASRSVTLSRNELELAHERAQRNAMELLGLPPGNTAAQRADAMFPVTAYRGFDVEAPQGHWYALTPEAAFQNKNTMGVFRLPGNIENARNFRDRRNGRFTDAVANELRRSGSRDDKKIADQLVQFAGADDIPTGEMIQFLKQSLGPEGAVDVYRRLLGTDGIAGLGNNPANLLMHPSTPVRSRFAAFDPARRNELDWLAGILAVPASALTVGDRSSDNGSAPYTSPSPRQSASRRRSPPGQESN